MTDGKAEKFIFSALRMFPYISFYFVNIPLSLRFVAIHAVGVGGFGDAIFIFMHAPK